MNWYYTENNQQRGPVTETEFDNLVAAGKITPDTLVWSEGMASWQPYREIAPTAPTGPVPPPLSQVMAPTATAPQRDGPPWEHRESLGLFNAVMETIKGVLIEPAETFARMKREGGFANPLQYGMLVGGIGSYMAVVYKVIAQQVQGFSATNGSSTGIYHFTPTTSVFVLIAAVFVIPLILALSSFFQAGILHLCLMMLGGANRPFETTYRVVCYSFGSAAVLQLIPICGGLASGIWNLVATCIGIAKAHEIPTGKAVLAVFLPVICCCGLFVMVFGVALATKGQTLFQH
ncbi:MAG: GYF domain-containing protein [Chthoniobacteraceae bacterium]